MGYSGKNSHSPDGGVWEILMGGGVEDSGDLGGKGGGGVQLKNPSSRVSIFQP